MLRRSSLFSRIAAVLACELHKAELESHRDYSKEILSMHYINALSGQTRRCRMSLAWLLAGIDDVAAGPGLLAPLVVAYDATDARTARYLVASRGDELVVINAEQRYLDAVQLRALVCTHRADR